MSNSKYIIGDWGGTNFRAALSTPDGLQDIYSYKCADYDSAHAILSQACLDIGIATSEIDFFVLAVAGPTNNPENFVFPNNLDLGTVNFTELGVSMGAPIILINDFAVQAYGALGLERSDFEEIIPVNTKKKLPKELWDPKAPLTTIVTIPQDNRFLVTGPGTGLGICTLGIGGAHITVTEGEGGHMNFACLAEQEHALLQNIQHHIGTVSYESLASGLGLVRIYKALTNNWQNEISAEEITQKALEGSNNAKETIRIFTLAFARAVGNAALLNLTRGGIIIPQGSIVSALGDHFDRDLFAYELRNNDFNATSERAEHNPLNNIPVYIMNHEETGILGTHIYAQSLK